MELGGAHTGVPVGLVDCLLGFELRFEAREPLIGVAVGISSQACDHGWVARSLALKRLRERHDFSAHLRLGAMSAPAQAAYECELLVDREGVSEEQTEHALVAKLERRFM